MTAYYDLISRIADQEPKNGFTSVAQFELTDVEIATVIAHDPDIIADALSPPTPTAQASIYWALSAGVTREQSDKRLAEVLRMALRVEAKRLVLIDLEEECDRRYHEQRAFEEQARRGEDAAMVWFEGA